MDVTTDVTMNDLVAFFVELGALILLGWWAWRLFPAGAGVRVVTVLVVLAAAIGLWALFAAPTAVYDVPPLAVAVKVLVLGGSALACWSVLHSLPVTLVWAAVVAVNTTLLYVGPFAR